MTLGAWLMSGIPPAGVGIYARDQDVEFLSGWDYVVLNAWRRDAIAKAAQLRAMGKTVWCYGMPSRFTPDTWREGVARCVRFAEDNDCAGFIADGEHGWPTLSRQRRDQEAAAFGTALADAANRTRVGFTSYPLWPGLAKLGEHTQGKVWGNIQLYGASLRLERPELMQDWWDRWAVVFGGGKLIPAVAGWVPTQNRQLNNPETYRRYLEMVPRAGGGIVWTQAGGAMPAHMLRDLQAWDPGDNPLLRAALIARSVASNPFLLAVVGLALVGAIVAALVVS